MVFKLALREEKIEVLIHIRLQPGDRELKIIETV